MRRPCLVWPLALVTALAGCGESATHPDEPLLLGEWGNESAVFIALRAGAEVRFACAVVVVDRPIELRDGTTFAFRGRLHTAPLTLGQLPEIRGTGEVGGSSVVLTLPMPGGDVVTLDLTAGVRPDPAELPTCPQ